jgi:hypothetical protein
MDGRGLGQGPGARHKRYLVNAWNRDQAIATLTQFIGDND